MQRYEIILNSYFFFKEKYSVSFFIHNNFVSLQRMNRMKIVRVFLALLIMAFAAQSCGRVASKDVRASKADSVLFDIGVVKDYEHMREVADKL